MLVGLHRGQGFEFFLLFVEFFVCTAVELYLCVDCYDYVFIYI